MTTACTPRRSRRTGRSIAIALGLSAAVLLAVGLPLATPFARAVDAGSAIGYAHPVATGPIHFAVNETDAPSYAPASLFGAAAGQSVVVHVVNQGRFLHTFTLESAPVPLSAHWTPAQLTAFFAANGTLANLSLAGGSSGWANFTIPANASGASFEFVSLIAYQFQAGMVGYLNVSAGGPSATLTDSVTSDFRFVPDVLVVNATKFPVVAAITVTNSGTLQHTFTLVPFAGVTLTPTNFSAFFNAHAPAIRLNIAPNSGASANGTFVLPAPGVYQFLCEINGHFQNGMNGTMYVGVPPPATAAPLSTALVQSWVLEGAGALIVLAVLLALATNYIGRFPAAAPPPPLGGSPVPPNPPPAH